MATVRELVATFGFDVDDSELKSLEKSLDTVKTTIFAVGAAAVGAAASMFGLAKNAADFADKIQDTAWAVGISNEFLQKLGHAAKLSGADIDTAANGMRILSRVMFDANRGLAESKEAFEAIGVQITDSNGKLRDTDTVFYEVSQAFSRMENGADKTALSMKLFGRSGAQLIPLMNSGADGIKAMGQEAEDLGLIMDDVSIQAGSDFNDNLDRLTGTISGLARSIGAGLFPVISDIMISMKEWIVANRDLIKTRINAFVDMMTRFIRITWRVVQGVTLSIIKLAQGVDSLLEPLGGLTRVLAYISGTFGLVMLGKFAAALGGVAKGFFIIGKAALFAWKRAFLGPLLIGAAVAGIFLIVEDLIAWLDGRPSFLGFLLKNKDQILEAIDGAIMSVVNWIGGLGTRIAQMLGASGAAAENWGGVIQAVLITVGAALTLFGAKALFAFAPMLATIGIVVLAIAAIGYAVMQTIKHWYDLKDTFNSLWNALLQGLSNTWLEIKNSFSLGVEWLTQLWYGLIDWFVMAGQRIYSAIVDPVKNAFAQASDSIKSGFGAVKDFFGFGSDVEATQKIENITTGQAIPTAGPSSLVSNNSSHVNNLQSTINVTVPPGGDAQAVGEAVRVAASTEFEKLLRPASRANQPILEY